MRRARNTKILSTLGPATANEKSIRALYEAGADVFRLNFSHGSHTDHRANVDTIRRIEAEVQRPIAILMDLQGPKLRVGKIKDGKVTLKEGQKYRFDLDPTEGDDKRAPLLHPEVFAVLTKGSILLLDDGKLRARVDKALDDGAEVTLMNGGVLSNHKGLNVPNVVLPLSAMTQKDRDDLQFGLDIGVDWVGLSFVQRPDDVAELRKLVAGRAAIMTKMEKPAAMLRLDEIVDLSDAVMVARGDLGVECPPEDVPALQKKIVRACRAKGRPVVVATQMLESMINSPAPTRAEASDVATAVYDGADAVMLSAETAVGEYPIQAVEMMDRIICKTENDPYYRDIRSHEQIDLERTAADAITAAAHQVANTIDAAAIVTFSSSGSTTLRAARERPEKPILGSTPYENIARRMVLVWGVHSKIMPDVDNMADMVKSACAAARDEGFARPGQRLVITAGVPFGTPGATNTLRIAWVGD
tara:strand:+ start:8141 stop:9559 length:1419 start_codon:yes stop_codon:yes gene_type:complete